MKFLSALLLTIAASQSFAGQCFDLSVDGKSWEAEPFNLCVEPNTGGTSEFKLTLSKSKQTVAIYYLDSLPSGGGLAFGVNATSGSILDDSLTIFIGYGEVSIGGGKYFYKE